MAAVAAAGDVAAERGRAARLDRPHDAKLGTIEVAGFGSAKRVTVAAEHVRHLDRGALHKRRLRRAALPKFKTIERALGRRD